MLFKLGFTIALALLLVGLVRPSASAQAPVGNPCHQTEEYQRWKKLNELRGRSSRTGKVLLSGSRTPYLEFFPDEKKMNALLKYVIQWGGPVWVDSKALYEDIRVSNFRLHDTSRAEDGSWVYHWESGPDPCLPPQQQTEGEKEEAANENVIGDSAEEFAIFVGSVRTILQPILDLGWMILVVPLLLLGGRLLLLRR